MAGLGFTPLGELGIPLRWAFKQPERLAATNTDEYGRGKNAMTQRILAAAGLTDAKRASIDANQVPSHDEVPR